MADTRTYTILGVVGSGGFGKVYRARMDAGDFTKEVAVKILHDPNPPVDTLKRFRDEARILGLLRDRAIVSVDPPTQLSGRWAVVMDFVDGQSAASLFKQLGPVPPGVALEIIAEVARVLDKAYAFLGPDGTPINLIHRDIKPANVQITRSGEVRLLDFGVATARFSAREAHTTTSISGTPGYLAPERLGGHESPAGDVYSLGVMLWVLVTGESPTERKATRLAAALDELAPDGPLRDVLQLAIDMRQLDDELRPTHRQVEQRCLDLRRKLPAPWLRDWADAIPPHHAEADELVGQRLSETLFRTRVDGGTFETGVGRTLLVGGGMFTLGGGLVGVLTLVGLLGVLGAAYLLSAPAASIEDRPTVPAPPDPEPSPAPLELEPPEPPVPAAADDPPPPEPEVVAPAPPSPPAPTPTPAPTPAPAPAPKPAPAPALVPAPIPVAPRPSPSPVPVQPEPVVDPAPAAVPVEVKVKSVPWGAEVSIDGRNVGRTPLKVALDPGAHRVELRLAGKISSRTVEVGEQRTRSITWSAEPDTWELTR